MTLEHFRNPMKTPSIGSVIGYIFAAIFSVGMIALMFGVIALMLFGLVAGIFPSEVKSLCERYSPWVKYEREIKPIREQWQKERHVIETQIWDQGGETLKGRFPDWAEADRKRESLEWSRDDEAYYAAQDAANAIAARHDPEFGAVEKECKRRIQQTEERVLKPKYPQFYK